MRKTWVFIRMPFKINISNKGKAYKLETESEALVGKSIGKTFNGEDINESLKGYELEITGTSDLSGIPGFKGLEGPGYHKRLLTYGPGMKDRRKGMRLRKTNRGQEISLKTHQINCIVKTEGEKKFADLIKKEEEAGSEPNSEAPNNTPQDKAPESKPESDNKEKETPAKPAENKTA